MKNSSLLITGLFSCFLLLSNFILAQDPTETNKDQAAKFSSIVNKPDVCEGYPYLSADGLRLYFTTDREGGFGRLYFCSRRSIEGNFGAPKPLSKNLPDGHYAATLTGDELTIYTSYKGEIYTAKRRSLSDQFGKPIIVEGLEEGRKYAPSVSQDGNELIIIYDATPVDDLNDVAIHYRKNAAGNFIEFNRLHAPGNIDIDPGQFSKDGLSFYASYEAAKPVPDDESRQYAQKIIRFTRNSLSDNFTTSEEVPGLNTLMRNHQPTMNEDGSIFIVTNSAADSWEENDLKLINLEINIEPIINYEVCCDCVKKVEEEVRQIPDTSTLIVEDRVYECEIQMPVSQEEIISADDNIESLSVTHEIVPESALTVKVYPNPFANNLIITLDKESLNSIMDLYDISGRKVLTTKLNNVTNRIQFNQPGSGIYIYKLIDKTGKLISSGKLVKK